VIGESRSHAGGGRFNSTFRGVLLLVLLLAGRVSIARADWRWPFPAGVSIDAGNAGAELWMSVSPRSGLADGEVTVYPVAPGEMIFRNRAPGAAVPAPNSVPDGSDRLVLRHEGEFWSFYRSPILQVEPGLEAGRVEAGTVAPIVGTERVAFGLYDAVGSVMVNPRAVLPETDLLPEDEMPVLGFRQSGRALRAANLLAGEAQLFVPEEWLELAALPRRLVVLVDGFLAADIDFLYPGEIGSRLMEGGLFLMETDLPPGRTTFEVESWRYDGSIDRRVIRVQVPQPVPLDTP
jgi:hypothetical protein